MKLDLTFATIKFNLNQRLCEPEKHFLFNFGLINKKPLSNGMPIEMVSKFLGHTKVATTQIYARVLDKKVEEEMNRLQEVLNSKKDKPKKSSGEWRIIR